MNDAPDTAREEAPPPPARRLSTVIFISVFVAAVLFSLIGYRYAIPTQANAWYLFQVARHTAWTLDKIGHHAGLETVYLARYEPRQVRATWDAWQAGQDAASEDALAAASDAPLTAWEVYRYRMMDQNRQRAAEAARAEAEGRPPRPMPGAFGPHVQFVLRPGLQQQLRWAEDELRTARLTPHSEARIAALEERIADLREEQRQLIASAGDADDVQAQAEIRRINRGYTFPFIVIPECGAIEVMAIFFAAVIAFPTRWWKRIVGVLLGIPLMYGVNIFRLSCLAVIGALDSDGHIFKLSHEYIWQAIYIVFVVGVWLAWIEFLVKRRS